MKIVYCTDLHGREAIYNGVLERAKAEKVDAIVNGGDMFPREFQNEFIQGFLAGHFEACHEAGIRYLCMPGNDDLAAWDEMFRDECQKHWAGCIHGMVFRLGDHEIIGFNFVRDYPFRLKDRCLKDYPGCPECVQFGGGLVSRITRHGKEGISNINWSEEINKRPNMRQALSLLPVPAYMSKAIYVIHDPPAGLGLDICSDGKGVGSVSVREFIEEKQPFLTLHGHIHESPDMSGKWNAQVGRTSCVQPGQGHCVVIDLDAVPLAMERSAVAEITRFYFQCPHCKGIIQTVSHGMIHSLKECPHCKHGLDEKDRVVMNAAINRPE